MRSTWSVIERREVSTGALENTSAGALLKSTGTLKNTSTGALQGEWDALEERKCLNSEV